MRIWTRKSALIQPRTSLGKSDCVVAERSPERRASAQALVRGSLLAALHAPRALPGDEGFDEPPGKVACDADEFVNILSNFAKFEKNLQFLLHPI